MMTLYGWSTVFLPLNYLYSVWVSMTMRMIQFLAMTSTKSTENPFGIWYPGKQGPIHSKNPWFFPHPPVETLDFALRQGAPNKAQLNCQVKSRFRRRLCRSQGGWNTKKPLVQLSLNLKNIRLMVRKSQGQPPAMQKKPCKNMGY